MMDRVPLEKSVDQEPLEQKVNRESTASRVVEDIAVNENDVIQASHDFRSLIEFLRVDPATAKDSETSDAILFLADWGKEKSKSTDMSEAIYALKELKESLGFQEVGAEGIKKLYSYIRLSDEQGKLFDRIKRIKKEKELLIYV